MHETMWFYLIVMSGFATGFSGCCWDFSVEKELEACFF